MAEPGSNVASSFFGSKSGTKILVIGMDGATFDLIKPWVSEGKLPNIGRLLSQGAHGELESVPNMCSAAAWPSFATGKNPGKHRIYWFAEPKQGSYEFRYANATFCKAETLWRLLSQAGKRVGVIHVPMTYPAEEVNGFLIAGIEAPSPDSAGFSYPPELISEVSNHCGPYIISAGLPEYVASDRVERGLEEIKRQIDSRLCAAQYLIKSKPWDFFMVVFGATDHAQHALWKFIDERHPSYNIDDASKYGDGIYQVYAKVDEAVGALLETVGDDVIVFVMSDHGGGLNQWGANHLNDWLEAEGYLKRMASLDGNNASRLLGATRRLALNVLGRAYTFIRLHLPRKHLGTLSGRFPKLRGLVESRLHYYDIDWSATRVYADGATDCLRINLKGREPEGIVEAGEEYEQLRDELTRKLYECLDPVTGKKVVRRVSKREEIYHGPYLERAADLEICWSTDGVIHGLCEAVLAKRKKFETQVDRVSGGHRPNGILIAKGTGIRMGARIEGARIIDLAPTILYLMGQKIPEDMDGTLLVDMLRSDFLDTHPIEYGKVVDPNSFGRTSYDAYTEAETRELEGRLRGLGYID
jgi:predicted AlkP superfamily phosphohydrolase/phosphomutase